VSEKHKHLLLKKSVIISHLQTVKAKVWMFARPYMHLKICFVYKHRFDFFNKN